MLPAEHHHEERCDRTAGAWPLRLPTGEDWWRMAVPASARGAGPRGRLGRHLVCSCTAVRFMSLTHREAQAGQNELPVLGFADVAQVFKDKWRDGPKPLENLPR